MMQQTLTQSERQGYVQSQHVLSKHSPPLWKLRQTFQVSIFPLSRFFQQDVPMYYWAFLL